LKGRWGVNSLYGFGVVAGMVGVTVSMYAGPVLVLYGNSEATRSSGIYPTFVAAVVGQGLSCVDFFSLWREYKKASKLMKWAMYAFVYAIATSLTGLAMKSARNHDRLQYELFLTVSSITQERETSQ
jgi:uncharacterized membrane protein YfcA